MPLVIAHRGASGEAPENTLPAFELACQQGADMIECDLHPTQSGEVVIRHDARLPPKAAEEGAPAPAEIAQATLAEVRAAAGAAVPTLEEVLHNFGARISWNLELKCDAKGRAYPQLPRLAWRAVEGRGLEGRVLFSSFSVVALRALRALSKQARLALLLSPRSQVSYFNWRARTHALGAEAVHPHIHMASAVWIAKARAAGFAVNVYTANTPEELRRLQSARADGVFTDHPARARRIFRGE